MAADKLVMTDDLRAVLHHAPDFIARLDTDLRYRYVNAAAERITGIPAEEWIGRRTHELGFAAEALAPGTRALEEALETGEPTVAVGRYEAEGGSTRWFEMRVVPEVTKGDAVQGLVFVARDVTERMEAFTRQEEAALLLQRTFESLSETVFVVDRRTRVLLDCNPAAEEMFGWTREELVGGTTVRLHEDEEGFLRFGHAARETLREGGVYRTRSTMRRRDGSVFPTEHTVTLLDRVDGEPARSVSVIRDRTEEVAATRGLRRANRRLRVLRELDRAILASSSVEEVAQATVRHAADTTGCLEARVTLAEEGRSEVRLVAVQGPGPSAPEGTRLPPFLFGSEEARDEAQVVEDIGALPEPRHPALEALWKAGVRGLVSVPLGGGTDRLGALTLWFAEPLPVDGHLQDTAREMGDHLTLGIRQLRLQAAVREEQRERRAAQDRAESLQVRLEGLLDRLDLGFFRVSPDGTIVERNDAARRILGFPEEATLVGRPIGEVLWPVERWQEILRRLDMDGGDQGSVQVRVRRHDGSMGWISAWARAILLPQGQTFIEGVFEDVTEEMHLREEVVGISTRERMRIGQDLHDDLGQHLTGLAFMARDLGRRLETDAPEAAAELRDLERLANLAVKKTRHLARGVHPPALAHRGLMGALAELARDAEDLFDITLLLEGEEPSPPCSTVEAAHLFRIAQEATTNAARHGAARTVRIRWGTEEGRRFLTVEDDGSGFGSAGGGSGLGLRIMRYRARLLGGELELDAAPDRGTRIRVGLPSHPMVDDAARADQEPRP